MLHDRLGNYLPLGTDTTETSHLAAPLLGVTGPILHRALKSNRKPEGTNTANGAVMMVSFL